MSRTRWMASVLDSAAADRTVMPWTRGVPRQENIARRREEKPKAALPQVPQPSAVATPGVRRTASL